MNLGREDPTERNRRPALRHVSLGIELIAPLLFGLFVGNWLDVKFGTEPWLLIAGVVLGMAAGFLGFFRSVLSLSRDRSPEDGDGE